MFLSRNNETKDNNGKSEPSGKFDTTKNRCQIEGVCELEDNI